MTKRSHNALKTSGNSTKIFAKKSLGQHFLVSPSIQQRIVDSSGFNKDDTILEIGPGTGIMTNLFKDKVNKIIAIEKDNNLAPLLTERFAGSNVTIIHDNILDYPFENLPEKIKVFGNLPYNIATPILTKLVSYRSQFPLAYVTVQLEYGQRCIAQPHGKDYGSLSCFLQYYADIQMLFKIRNTAFSPPPKVQSCFLKLSFPKSLPLKAHDENLLFKIIRHAFNQRRKTILNSLSPLKDKRHLSSLFGVLHISPQSRAENLKLKDYVDLANFWNKFEGDEINK
jgi:16S rRNA (adenine1518-N6/adenine1519-N6)-dimethyltransferase